MQATTASALEAWQSFYVIVGSSAGALTGLQFVVLTLIGESAATRGRKETISAFGSPNVVHFCAALLVASILSAPWSALRYPGIAVGICGALGVVYSAIVLNRALRQTAYRPVFEDWLWHTVLPLLAYAALFVSGVMLGGSSADALFAVGGALLLLVFIGIHNAWDTVTYVMAQQGEQERAQMAAAARAGGESERPPGTAAPRGPLPGPGTAAHQVEP